MFDLSADEWVAVQLSLRIAIVATLAALPFGIAVAWLLKFVLFLVLVFLLRDQPWIHPQVLFFSIVAGVIGTLVVDVVVVAKSRMPYVSDITLPGEAKDDEKQA